MSRYRGLPPPKRREAVGGLVRIEKAFRSSGVPEFQWGAKAGRTAPDPGTTALKGERGGGEGGSTPCRRSTDGGTASSSVLAWWWGWAAAAAAGLMEMGEV